MLQKLQEEPKYNHAESRKFSPPVSLLFLSLDCRAHKAVKYGNNSVGVWVERRRRQEIRRPNSKRRGGKMKADWWIEHRKVLSCRRKNIDSQIREWGEPAPAFTPFSLEKHLQREDIKFSSPFWKTGIFFHLVVAKWKKIKSIKLIFSYPGVGE